MWRQLPQAHNPPFPKTPTKFERTFARRHPPTTRNFLGLFNIAQLPRLWSEYRYRYVRCTSNRGGSHGIYS